MSQHDYVIDNQNGAAFRADLNNVLAAIVTNNSSTTAPTTTYAHMAWVDTSGATPILKFRNASNSGWVTLGDVSVTNLGLQIAGNYVTYDASTGAATIPSGTTAQRPASPVGKMIRYNTTTGGWEGYNGTAWAAIGGSSGTLIPTGTAMLFAQTAAPTGFTKVTTHDNKALRVVSGTAGSGGSVAFTTAFASQTPTGSVSVNVSGLSAGATTLSTAQMPSHAHNVTGINNGCGSSPNQLTSYGGNGSSFTNATDSQGGGGSHSHAMSGSATGSFTGTAINLAVSYVDVIIATKD